MGQDTLLQGSDGNEATYRDAQEIVLRPRDKYALITYYLYKDAKAAEVDGEGPVAGAIQTTEITDPAVYEQYFSEPKIHELLVTAYDLAPGGTLSVGLTIVITGEASATVSASLSANTIHIVDGDAEVGVGASCAGTVI